MNKPHSLILTLGVMLSASAGVSSALAGDLFEPRNSHLTQSTLAPGSRAFVVVENEVAVKANERYVRQPKMIQRLFATRQRDAIARWLASAEGRQSAPDWRLTYRPGLTSPRR